MIRKLKSATGNEYEHDDTIDEDTMRRNLPVFFKFKHGKRETYTIYRGFIIVRLTRQNERVAVLYMYYPDGPGSIHVKVRSYYVTTIKRQIDRILATGDLTA